MKIPKFNVFGSLRKGLNWISKATKIFLSLQSVQQHATALIDDLEKIWHVENTIKEVLNEEDL